MVRIQNILVKCDYVSDFIPVWETLTNIITLVAKGILHFLSEVLKWVNNETIRSNPLLCHWKGKPAAECLLLTFPLGIIIRQDIDTYRQDRINNYPKSYWNNDKLFEEGDFLMEVFNSLPEKEKSEMGEQLFTNDFVVESVKKDPTRIDFFCKYFKAHKQVALVKKILDEAPKAISELAKYYPNKQNKKEFYKFCLLYKPKTFRDLPLKAQKKASLIAECLTTLFNLYKERNARHLLNQSIVFNVFESPWFLGERELINNQFEIKLDNKYNPENFKILCNQIPDEYIGPIVNKLRTNPKIIRSFYTDPKLTSIRKNLSLFQDLFCYNPYEYIDLFDTLEFENHGAELKFNLELLKAGLSRLTWELRNRLEFKSINKKDVKIIAKICTDDQIVALFIKENAKEYPQLVAVCLSVFYQGHPEKFAKCNHLLYNQIPYNDVEPILKNLLSCHGGLQVIQSFFQNPEIKNIRNRHKLFEILLSIDNKLFQCFDILEYEDEKSKRQDKINLLRLNSQLVDQLSRVSLRELMKDYPDMFFLYTQFDLSKTEDFNFVKKIIEEYIEQEKLKIQLVEQEKLKIQLVEQEELKIQLVEQEELKIQLVEQEELKIQPTSPMPLPELALITKEWILKHPQALSFLPIYHKTANEVRNEAQWVSAETTHLNNKTLMNEEILYAADSHIHKLYTYRNEMQQVHLTMLKAGKLKPFTENILCIFAFRKSMPSNHYLKSVPRPIWQKIYCSQFVRPEYSDILLRILFSKNTEEN